MSGNSDDREALEERRSEVEEPLRRTVSTRAVDAEGADFTSRRPRVRGHFDARAGVVRHATTSIINIKLTSLFLKRLSILFFFFLLL
jgi:hypothetical protein